MRITKEAGKFPRTKQQLADAFLELSKVTEVPRISVKEICEMCGILRQSFYYHFHDKYELVAWIFEQDFMMEARRAEQINSEEMICSMLHRLQAREAFYRSAIQDVNQNNLYEYIIQLYITMNTEIMRVYLKTDVLDSELLYDLQSYSYACAFHTREWLAGREKMSPELFAERMYRDMPELLKKAYQTGIRPACFRIC